MIKLPQFLSQFPQKAIQSTQILKDIQKHSFKVKQKGLFEDDFASNNRVQFNGVFGSKTSLVKLNVLAQNLTKDNSWRINEEAELVTSLGSNNSKFIFKPGNVRAILDLQKRHYVNAKNNTITWVNPYVEANVNRNLQRQVVSLGILAHRNNKLMKNFRLNFFTPEDKLNVLGDYHVKYQCCNIMAQVFLKFDLLNFLAGTLQKRFSLEYQKNDFTFSLDNNQNKQSQWTELGGQTQLGISYRNNQNNYGWLMDLNKEDITKSTHALGFEGKIKDTRVKAKVNNLLDAEFFANHNCGSGLSVATSIGGNLRKGDQVGFLGSPVNFGVKISYLD